LLNKDAHERPSAKELLDEGYISGCIKEFIQKSMDSSHTPERVAALINAVAAIGEAVLDDELFGEFDDKSTLKSTPKSTLRSSDDTFDRELAE
jgi:hypothetical protein